MVDNLCHGDCMFKRERLQSLPSDCYSPDHLSRYFVNRHRNSDVTPYQSSDSSSLQKMLTDDGIDIVSPKISVGVKSYYEWRPRRYSVSQLTVVRANDSIVEAGIVHDQEIVLRAQEPTLTCYKSTDSHLNPLKSTLLMRVLYMLSCSSDEDKDPLPSIQDQFLTDEQIRENLLKEQRESASRLNHDLCQDSAVSHSGNVTPSELISNKLTNMKRIHSLVNMRRDDLNHVSSVSSMDGYYVDTSPTAVPVHSRHNDHSRGNNTSKLSGREKNWFAPVTF